MKKRGAAFTLVELLVVVVVVGILAALLLTTVSNSKAKAHTAVCAGNLRQWGIAISMNAGRALNATKSAYCIPPASRSPIRSFKLGTNSETIMKTKLSLLACASEGVSRISFSHNTADS